MRIRTIKPEFWKSQTLSLLSAETRLLAIALLNYADDEGYFFAHPALIRGELMPFAERHDHIPALLEQLKEAGYIRLGEDAAKRQIGLVVNFKKHQLVNRPQKSKLAGTVDFPNWSPALPVVLREPSQPVQLPLTEASMSDHGSFTDDSVNDHGAFTAGMDQGSGNGMDQGSGNGKGDGKPSPDKPGGTSASAESSIPEPDPGVSKPDAAALTILPSAKKKKGGAAEPEFPAEVGEEYRHSLRQWWVYKRERHEGYKPAGWAALIKQQMKFPAEQVLASIEHSMASNWAGLFTHKFEPAVDPSRSKWDGKKERAAAVPLTFSDAPTMDDFAPPDWRLIWEELFSGPCPETWDDVPDVNKKQIRAHIAAKK